MNNKYERLSINALNYWTSCNDLPTEVVEQIKRTPETLLYLPTEIVIRKPTLAVPSTMRVWRYFRYLGMFPLADGNGQGSRHTMLLEVWVDNGDDGHTDYSLIGYAEVSEEDGQKYIEWMEGDSPWLPDLRNENGEWVE